MKLRRRHLEERYRKLIDALYAEDAPATNERAIEHARR